VLITPSLRFSVVSIDIPVLFTFEVSGFIKTFSLSFSIKVSILKGYIRKIVLP